MVAVSSLALFGLLCPVASLSASRLAGGSSRAAVAVRMDFFTDLKKGFTRLQAGTYDAAAVRATLQNQIKRKPCVIYATTTCPFCTKAKDVLSGMGAMYTIVDLDQEDDGMAIKAELADITGITSVPQVFVGGQFIGGCNDGGMGGVATLFKSGKLEALLIKAGALSPKQRT